MKIKMLEIDFPLKSRHELTSACLRYLQDYAEMTEKDIVKMDKITPEILSLCPSKYDECSIYYNEYLIKELYHITSRVITTERDKLLANNK